MEWILIQPVDNDEPSKAAHHLLTICICLFELTKNGVRLQPIAFGSRSCNENEKIFILSRVKVAAVVGLLAKIESSYGDAIFIGFTTAQLSRKFWSMRAV